MNSTTLNCPLCGAAEFDEFTRKDKFVLVKCRSCKFVFIPPACYNDTDRGGIRSQYEQDATSPVKYYLSTRYFDMKYAGQNLKELEKHMKPGSVLDVGCNVGSFMLAARNRGWKPEGIEPNTSAASHASKEGFDVHNGFFTTEFAKSRAGRYDAVNLGDVIEHVFDPVYFLKNAYTTLRPGGAIMIITCNVDSYWSRKYQIKPMEHLLYFNTKTIKLACEKAGFTVVKCARSSHLRDIANMSKGTTKLGLGEKIVMLMTRTFKLGKLISFLMSLVIIDELILIGKKPSA